MDENLENETLKQEEYKDFKENAELKAIIAGKNARRRSIKVGEIEIHIRPAIPKGMRDRLAKISMAYQNEDVETGDEEMYEVMSEICVNPPGVPTDYKNVYNNPKAWKYIDEETGEVPNILKLVIEEITETEGAAKRFRSK